MLISLLFYKNWNEKSNVKVICVDNYIILENSLNHRYVAEVADK